MKTEEIRYETLLTQTLFQRATIKRIPLSGTFELSPICNFDCKMCYVKKSADEVNNSPRKMLTLEQWKHIADQAQKEGLLYLLLTGGEPFLWPDFEELYCYLAKKGFVISINSNGYLIDRNVVDLLANAPPTRINITLYGASNDTYERLCGVKNGFDKIKEAIDLLKNAGILVKLNCSLTPYNADDLKEMIRFAEERNLILEVNTYMFPPIRREPAQFGMNERFTAKESAYWNVKRYKYQHSLERYERWLEALLENKRLSCSYDKTCVDPIDGKVSCRAGKAAFWVTWDGLMLPCGMMPKPEIDLIQNGFTKAWQLIIEETEKISLSGICNKCPQRGTCRSCAAMAIAETGEFGKIPTYLCEMVESVYEIAKTELEVLKRRR